MTQNPYAPPQSPAKIQSYDNLCCDNCGFQFHWWAIAKIGLLTNRIRCPQCQNRLQRQLKYHVTLYVLLASFAISAVLILGMFVFSVAEEYWLMVYIIGAQPLMIAVELYRGYHYRHQFTLKTLTKPTEAK